VKRETTQSAGSTFKQLMKEAPLLTLAVHWACPSLSSVNAALIASSIPLRSLTLPPPPPPEPPPPGLGAPPHEGH